MYATLQIKNIHFCEKGCSLCPKREVVEERVYINLIQLYLKKIKRINSFTWQCKKLLTQKSNELSMSLYAGIHVYDGSIPVAMCIFIKLWSPKKGLKKPLQTTSRTFMQNNRVHKTSVRVITCCWNFGFIIWTTTSLKIKYTD